MTLPASGPISINQVNIELGVAGNTQRSFNDAALRTLFAVPSGPISMFNGFGKSSVTPGSENYTTPGTYYFKVPGYRTMTVEQYGGAGGGMPGIQASGTGPVGAGGSTSFAGILICTGGGGGTWLGAGGAGGTASGGDQNYTGGQGGVRYSTGMYGTGGTGGAAGGYGALASAGATADAVGFRLKSPPGKSYGGAAAGGGSGNISGRGGAGGDGGGGGGGLFKTFTNGVGNAPIVGTTIELVIGAGGIGRDTTYTSINGGGSGGNGSGGAIFISWN